MGRASKLQKIDCALTPYDAVNIERHWLRRLPLEDDSHENTGHFTFARRSSKKQDTIQYYLEFLK